MSYGIDTVSRQTAIYSRNGAPA